MKDRSSILADPLWTWDLLCLLQFWRIEDDWRLRFSTHPNRRLTRIFVSRFTVMKSWTPEELESRLWVGQRSFVSWFFTLEDCKRDNITWQVVQYPSIRPSLSELHQVFCQAPRFWAFPSSNRSTPWLYRLAGISAGFLIGGARSESPGGPSRSSSSRADGRREDDEPPQCGSTVDREQSEEITRGNGMRWVQWQREGIRDD